MSILTMLYTQGLLYMYMYTYSNRESRYLKNTVLQTLLYFEQLKITSPDSKIIIKTIK